MSGLYEAVSQGSVGAVIVTITAFIPGKSAAGYLFHCRDVLKSMSPFSY